VQEEEVNEVKELPKKKSWLKRLLKVILYIVLIVLGLNLILYILLSIPAVQQKVVDFAIGQIKPVMKTEVSIDKVRIGLFNHVNLEGVYVESQEKDTLLYAGELDVKLSIWGLLRNKVEINSINLDRAFVNVSQKDPDAPFNFQFIIDAFSDTTQQDTSASSMEIIINDIRITNSRINYNVLSEPETPGVFNPSHISLSALNTHLKLPSIDILKLNAEILSLSVTEKSGLAVKDVEAKLKSGGTKIWSEKFKITLPYSDLVLDTLKYNLFSKEFSINGNVNLSPKDMAVFMPELNKLDTSFVLSTNISGKLPEIKIRSLALNYGEDMSLQANASISDYEHYESSRLQLNIDKFKITPKAISAFARIADSTFVAPEMLSIIGQLRLKAEIEGRLDNLNLNAEAWTDQGAVELVSEISVKDTTFQNYRVDASLQTQNFNLAPFVGKEVGLGRVSAHSIINLASVENNLSAKVNGSIDRLQHDSVIIKGIKFEADYDPRKMSARINAALPIGSLAAEASMTQEKNPQINFDVDIYNLKIDRFYNNPSWENPQLSLCVNGKLKGNSIDNIEGMINIDSLRLWGDNFNYAPGRLVLESAVDDGNRFIKLESFLLSAKIDGQYQFSTLPDEFSNMMHHYLPGFFAENRHIRKYNNNLNIDINIHNTETLSKLLDLPASIIQPVKIHGVVNTIDNRIKVDADIPFIRFGENNIKGSSINIFNNDTVLNLNASTRLIQQSGDFILSMGNIIKSDTINTTLSFKNEDPDISIAGELAAASHFEMTRAGGLRSSMEFKPTRMTVKDLGFSFLPAKIENIGDRTTISNFGFMVGRGRVFNRYFAVDGAISNQKQDTLKINFTNARLSRILNAFDINNISTTIDGDLKLTNLLQNPEFYTDNLQLRDIIVFNDTLGTMNVKSEWSNTRNAIGLDVSLTNKDIQSRVHGLVYAAENKLDLNIDLERLSMKWLQPFMSDMLDRVDGSISSRITVKGSMNAPRADGWLGFNNAYVGVDFTNVTYHINDTIKVLSDKVGFRNLIIQDDNKNKATASALVDYSELSNPKFLMNLDLDNFLVLNTQSRTDSLYYGRLNASGNVKIRGNMDDIKVDMNIRNERNSTMNITIPEVSEAYDYQGVVFINVPQQDSSRMLAPPEKPLPLNLEMDLTVDPTITLGIVMNSSNPLQMQMKGQGLIKFNYNLEADNMTTYGSYTITDGTVKIRPQNLKTLEFRIQNGSKLNLVGDPMNTTFDLIAYYRVNASLRPLGSDFSTSKIPVNCVLGIKGNMKKMDLTYNVELPNASDDIKQKVKAIISTDDEKIRQFGNLILFSSFYASAGGTGDSNMLGALASTTLSGGLNALFGSLLGDNWQIGTNIDTSDGSFSDADVSVNASTRLFDDRLTFTTNLGYRNDKATSGNNDFIGDFDVEYQLSNTIKLKAYTHTNDKFYKQAATTQGIGVVYTKEAKTIKELFRFFRKKKANENIKED